MTRTIEAIARLLREGASWIAVSYSLDADLMPHGDEHGPAEAVVERLLDKVNFPKDLKSLTTKELEALAAEIRKQIIDVAARNGGHLAPHLGVVELALSVHYRLDVCE